MYVILTRRPGRFRTEPGPGIEPLEAHELHADDRLRACFVIARLDRETRVQVIDDDPAQPVNSIPSKFLPRFASLQAARDELAQLTRYDHGHTRLVSVPLPPMARTADDDPPC